MPLTLYQYNILTFTTLLWQPWWPSCFMIQDVNLEVTCSHLGAMKCIQRMSLLVTYPNAPPAAHPVLTAASHVKSPLEWCMNVFMCGKSEPDWERHTKCQQGKPAKQGKQFGLPVVSHFSSCQWLQIVGSWHTPVLYEALGYTRPPLIVSGPMWQRPCLSLLSALYSFHA